MGPPPAIAYKSLENSSSARIFQQVLLGLMYLCISFRILLLNPFFHKYYFAVLYELISEILGHIVNTIVCLKFFCSCSKPIPSSG